MTRILDTIATGGWRICAASLCAGLVGVALLGVAG
jgi:hypothetical protein